MTNDERSNMTPALRDHLNSLTDSQRTRMATDSRKALRLAWPSRHTPRGKMVVISNVTMLRNIRAL